MGKGFLDWSGPVSSGRPSWKKRHFSWAWVEGSQGIPGNIGEESEMGH